MSVFTLVFIAVDRLICICFPFSKHRFNMTATYRYETERVKSSFRRQFNFCRLIAVSWGTAILMATLPLIVTPYFKQQFYSRSGVCLPLHITNHKPAGWEYSVAIFLCVNLFAFLIIVGCYCYMYKTIRLSNRRMSRLMARQVRETQVIKGFEMKTQAK